MEISKSKGDIRIMWHIMFQTRCPVCDAITVMSLDFETNRREMSRCSLCGSLLTSRVEGVNDKSHLQMYYGCAILESKNTYCRYQLVPKTKRAMSKNLVYFSDSIADISVVDRGRINISVNENCDYSITDIFKILNSNFVTDYEFVEVNGRWHVVSKRSCKHRMMFGQFDDTSRLLKKELMQKESDTDFDYHHFIVERLYDFVKDEFVDGWNGTGLMQYINNHLTHGGFIDFDDSWHYPSMYFINRYDDTVSFDKRWEESIYSKFDVLMNTYKLHESAEESKFWRVKDMKDTDTKSDRSLCAMLQDDVPIVCCKDQILEEERRRAVMSSSPFDDLLANFLPIQTSPFGADKRDNKCIVSDLKPKKY